MIFFHDWKADLNSDILPVVKGWWRESGYLGCALNLERSDFDS